MYILHIETSTKVCSVAISEGDTLISCIEETEGMNHTALLAPMIGDLLKATTLKASDLEAITVSAGPGSYTGLRVGGSTAKAMAYSLGIPLISVPTLLSLALAGFQQHPEADLALPMLDARRNEVYLSMYDTEMKEIFATSSVILDKDNLHFIPSDKTIVCCGDGAFKLDSPGLVMSRMIINTQLVASAKNLVRPAFRLLAERHFSDPLHYVPFYLKPPNITQPKAPGNT